ncbi:MAG: dehypoxanthine futalosine cyclase [Elusimicrobia bacterium]|nr:dehypoxanthine futalosine cyclase [Candidatus Obscuribacterium magneticum]
MNVMLADQIEKKVLEGSRLSPKEGLYLLKDAPFLWLGWLADGVRSRHHPRREVTFVIDTNPNYTNICETGCQFCAFYRRPRDPDAYALTVEQVMEKIRWAVGRGATTVLLQGGHHPELPLGYYLDLVRETVKRFPGVTPHFFSAPEIENMARVAGLTLEEVLRRLWDAGQRTLPGGGAEILSERVRKRISPKKGGPQTWLQVHRQAHEIGFLSTATLMFGHVEEPEDIVQHWESIRNLQEESRRLNKAGRFTAFIPWSFKPTHTALEKRVPRHVGPIQYLRILAASRLYLDNVDHIQASWFSEGKKIAPAALQFGADDFGGTLYEENVHKEAGFVNVAGLEELVTLIHEAGYDAVQRTTAYERLKSTPREALIFSSV